MSQSPFKITRYGIIGNLTGSVQGTASYALTASYMSGAVMSETVRGIEKITSASYATIVPDPKTLYVITDGTASAESASYAVHADTASFMPGLDSRFLPITGGIVNGDVVISGSLTQGEYNATASGQVFSVGYGSSDADRKNAISVIVANDTASVYIKGVSNYDGTNPTPGRNDIETTIGSLRLKPITIYETDGTTGLLGHNSSSFEGNWQLENLDLTLFKRIECYFKAAATQSADYFTPAVIVTVPLDDAAKGPTSYFGSTIVALPFNRNRQYLVGCAVDATKTKFQVVHQNTLWDITVSDANNTSRYCYKILGYFD